MAKNIYFVGGSKGGVGKSLVAMATIDLLQQQDEKILLIESDTGNPDVWKAYQESIECKLLNLDEADGWIDFVNACEGTPDHVVVVNSAARNSRGVTDYGNTLHGALSELKRQLVTLWVVDRHRDSLELLRDYMTAIPDSQLHVVRNARAGREDEFEFYNTSKIRAQVEDHGGKSVMFPVLAKRVIDSLYIDRMTIDDIAKKAPLGNRAELMRWRSEVTAALGGIVHG